MPKTWKIAGINFDHMHMGDLLRMAKLTPNSEIVGVADESMERMTGVLDRMDLPRSLATTDYRGLLDREKPDLVILCPATARHAEWTEKVAAFGAHIMVEKPFAASLEEADRMIAAVESTGKQLAINWPLRWYPSHMTAKRVIDEGTIGDIVEVHYYDGNQGPLRHLMEKIEIPLSDPAQKGRSWWYQKSEGGGSLLDYLGYGVTLGTWFLDGKAPLAVTAVVDQPEGLEVDEHCIAVCRYENGLSKFETRWGAFTDPWTHQPQPKCGFVLVGTGGTISSYDYETTIRLQTRERPEGYAIPVDEPIAPFRNPIEYVLDCLERESPVEGPLSPKIARVGQRIVDTAVRSAAEKRTLSLLP